MSSNNNSKLTWLADRYTMTKLFKNNHYQNQSEKTFAEHKNKKTSLRFEFKYTEMYLIRSNLALIPTCNTSIFFAIFINLKC